MPSCAQTALLAEVHDVITVGHSLANIHFGGTQLRAAGYIRDGGARQMVNCSIPAAAAAAAVPAAAERSLQGRHAEGVFVELALLLAVDTEGLTVLGFLLP